MICLCRKTSAASPALAVHVRCHQGKCSLTALPKLCSVLPCFYIFHPLTSIRSLFLSSVSQIIAFLPNFSSSSSQRLCEEGSSAPGISASPEGETWLGECLPACTQGSIRKGPSHTVFHPDLSSSQLFPADPFSAPSSQHCSWLLCHSYFSVPKPSPLLSIPMQSLTKNLSSGSLLTFWT